MRKLFEILPLMLISITGYSQCDSNKVIFVDSLGKEISANQTHLIPKELLITVELKEQDGKTHLHMTQAPMPAEMHADCVKGWQECFDKLESNVK